MREQDQCPSCGHRDSKCICAEIPIEQVEQELQGMGLGVPSYKALGKVIHRLATATAEIEKLREIVTRIPTAIQERITQEETLAHNAPAAQAPIAWYQGMSIALGIATREAAAAAKETE